MYNQSYINDFSLDNYQSYLNDYNKLNGLKCEYLKQYNDDSNAIMLAFKESLDHYVLKKVVSDESYMDSREFKNYLNYLMYIVDEKKVSIRWENI